MLNVFWLVAHKQGKKGARQTENEHWEVKYSAVLSAFNFLWCFLSQKPALSWRDIPNRVVLISRDRANELFYSAMELLSACVAYEMIKKTKERRTTTILTKEKSLGTFQDYCEGSYHHAQQCYHRRLRVANPQLLPYTDFAKPSLHLLRLPSLIENPKNASGI